MNDERAASRRKTREAVVVEHMESENALDFDATLATFSHPRYELVATGQVFDGADEVMGYFPRASTREEAAVYAAFGVRRAETSCVG